VIQLLNMRQLYNESSEFPNGNESKWRDLEREARRIFPVFYGTIKR
jgi:hypothetical protein